MGILNLLQPPGGLGLPLQPTRPSSVAVVRPSAGSDDARMNGDDRPSAGDKDRKGILAPLPGPEPPTGPPPTFAANLLEIEERRRRAGPEPPAPLRQEPARTEMAAAEAARASYVTANIAAGIGPKPLPGADEPGK